MDLAIRVVVPEEVDGREDRDGILLVVDVIEVGHMRIDIVREGLVTNLMDKPLIAVN